MPGICAGRVVIITGAGRGIGRGHALEFARQGAQVVVNDIGAELDGSGGSSGPAGEVVEAIRAMGGEAIANGDDVSDWDGAKHLVDSAIDAFGDLHVVVNNAGVVRDRMFANATEDEWDLTMKVHLKGHFAPARFAVAHWRDQAKAGQTVDARIINTTSGAGLMGSVGQSAYSTAKAGIAGLTLVQAAELGRYGITANAIAPSARTRMTEEVFAATMAAPDDADAFDEMAAENVAPLVVWLGSADSAGVTGRVFEVEGGKVSVADGWRHGTVIDNKARWEPADVGPAVRELIAHEPTPTPVYGRVLTVPTPLVDPGELAAQAAFFRQFGGIIAKRLPLYKRVCLAAADDPEVVARVFLAAPEQRRVTLLLAAIHDVVLAGDGGSLAAWYASVTDRPRPVGAGGDDPWPHFRLLALEHDGVAERLATRSTQTNEVGRCAPMVLALGQVSADAPLAPSGRRRPIGLIEIGASAGLNLRLDHYAYRFEPGRDGVAGGAVGSADGRSLLELTCQVRGTHAVPVPARLPYIGSRVGLDLRPVDLAEPAEARWLVACQWPDQLDRIHRLRTAIALAHGDQPRIVRGDTVDDLAPLVEAVAPNALPVVMSTWVLSYVPEVRRRALMVELERLGRGRDLTLVFTEQPDEVPGIPIPPRPDGPDDPRFSALVRIDWRDGERTVRRLADQHPHGTWIEWLAD